MYKPAKKPRREPATTLCAGLLTPHRGRPKVSRRHRHGMTLVELLIVVTIMTILLAVAIPRIRPAFQDRNLREASRQVNTFLAGARARAQTVGRPVGVWIEQIDTTETGSRAAQQLYMAEVAAPFSGGLVGTRVTASPAAITLTSPPAFAGVPLGRLYFWTDAGMPSPSDAALLANLLEVSEVFTIQFDHRGAVYPGIRAPDSASDPYSPYVFLIPIPGGPPPGTTHPPSVPAAPGTGVPFAITRGPVRSGVNPITLPADSVIDLAVSGVGSSGNEFNPASTVPALKTPVIITFTPTGGVDYVYAGNRSYRPFGAVHLMIGRRAEVVDPSITNFTDPTLETNLTNPANLWVSIGHRTGRIVTTNNMETRDLPAGTTVPDRIRAARAMARSSLNKGGR